MNTAFELDPRLAADTLLIGDSLHHRYLLMNDARYPWVILVPRGNGLREIYQLDPQAQQALAQESLHLGQTLMTHFGGHKLNVAALGNVVAQLHIHHIVRFEDDDAWPAPVWGKHPAIPYTGADARQRIAELRARIALWIDPPV
ncbi:HIT domain-containing protein [Sinimarinibacterium sp. NLF-5-8]|uniref:HIT domain-containing protein n=1 Tax=Sinimarinibacterium sp. NLF-5-8 TaxID=2698684 RepID=UPI00137BA439|nr:HIT family protein [Sinimarinibacterium sp. NLF-5-8]QHS10769.1 HIT family protein [Sinimarinibacterium sp. NLF-5-8]